MNDTHGAFLNDDNGFPRIKTLLKSIKPDLILHAGDFNTGPLESNAFYALPDIIALNDLKIDALTLGNHDFDVPKSVFLWQKKKIQFPILGGNVLNEKHQPACLPYIIKIVKGLKIAIIGVSTLETMVNSLYGDSYGYTWSDPVDFIKKTLQEIQHKSDIRILLSHLGQYEKTSKFFGDFHLMDYLEEGDIHVILGGHTRKALDKPLLIKNTFIGHAGASNEYLGEVNLVKKNNTFSYSSLTLHKITKEIEEDKALKKKLLSFKEYSLKSQKNILGEFLVQEKNDPVLLRKQTTSYGTFIAKALKRASPLSLICGGCIRVILEAGQISEKNIQEMFPFPNRICSVKTSVENFHDYYNNILKTGRTFPQLSAKITKQKECLKVDQTLFCENISFETTDFLLKGGDFYPNIFKNDQFLITCSEESALSRALSFFEKNPIIHEKIYYEPL